MDMGGLICILIAWQILGGLVLSVASATSTGWIGLADGWEFVNPFFVYKYCKSVNWFGAFVLAMFLTAICPFGALCYWFYKLCTVGRR